MKRVKTLIGNDDNARITISVKVEDFGLSQIESSALMDNLVDQIMEVLPKVLYTRIALNRIVIK